ncbi:MAG: hypothetical protein FIA94_07265 [Nitrospirae bacterium]|nr:hypothetical protein [Nitrospirota bacterium]
MKRIKAPLLIALCIALMSSLLACNAPTAQRIASDFKEVFSKEADHGLTPVITSSGPGEGDSDNVYEHIKFDVTVSSDVAMSTGWFAGRSLKRGQKLTGGEVVMLYQKDKSSQWKLSSYELKRLPQ